MTSKEHDPALLQAQTKQWRQVSNNLHSRVQIDENILSRNLLEYFLDNERFPQPVSTPSWHIEDTLVHFVEWCLLQNRPIPGMNLIDATTKSGLYEPLLTHKEFVAGIACEMAFHENFPDPK